MAKLHDILNKLQGTEFEGMIVEINTAVDSIKAKAKESSNDNSSSKELEKALATLKEKEEALVQAQNELKPLKEKDRFEQVVKSYNESLKGKEGIDLSNYNYHKFENEDGEIDWDGFLEANPHLKQAREIKKDPTLDDGFTTKEFTQALEETKERDELIKTNRTKNV